MAAWWALRRVRLPAPRLLRAELTGSVVVLLAYGVLLVNTWGGFQRLPTGYIPTADGPEYMHDTLGEVHVMGELKGSGVD